MATNLRMIVPLYRRLKHTNTESDTVRDKTEITDSKRHQTGGTERLKYSLNTHTHTSSTKK